MKPAIRKWVNFFVFILTLLVNWAASSSFFNNTSMSEAAARYEVWIIPSGFTFGIWSIIYLFLICFVFFQLNTRNSKSNHITLIGNYFIYSCILNALWLITYQYNLIWLSLIIMIALLMVLVRIYTNIRKDHKFTSQENWFIKFPFSLYTTWITLATILNISSFLQQMIVEYNWSFINIFPTQVWSLIVITVALFLALMFLWYKKDPVSSLVFIWALIGISHKNYVWANAKTTINGVTVLGINHLLIVVYSLAGIAIIVSALAKYWIVNKEKRKNLY